MTRTKYLTTSEAAEILGVTERRIRDFCKAARLGRKIGRNWAISESQLAKFAAVERRVGQSLKSS